MAKAKIYGFADLSGWWEREQALVQRHLDKNRNALRNSPLPKDVLANLALMIPFHLLHRYLPTLDAAYLERKNDYDSLRI